jgi:hypothetical protein
LDKDGASLFMFERELPPTSACPFILAVEIPSTRLVYLFKSSMDLKVEQMGADVYKCGMCTSQHGYIRTFAD